MSKNHRTQIIDTTQDPQLDRQFNVRTPIADVRPKSKPRQALTWVADTPDSRDYIYRTTVSSMPLQVDLRRYCSPIENQGSLGSCTGHAISSAMEIILNRQNRMTEISRLFIYYQERLLEGTVNWDSGAYIRDGIKSCYTWGAPQETLWQYNPKNLTVRPSPQAYADAIRRRVTEYRRCPDFNAVKAALATENPVVAGFLVYTSFMTTAVAKTGKMPYPNVRNERLLGGHAVLIVGYDDSRQVFTVKNSWGSSWGDGGYFYMPYQVIQNTAMSSDFWVISDITR